MVKTKAAPPDTAVQTRFRGDCVMGDSRTKAKLVSPCISVCQMDAENGVCLGCYRTRGEIAAWPRMTADQQNGLLNELRDRRAAATGARGRVTMRKVKTD